MKFYIKLSILAVFIGFTVTSQARILSKENFIVPGNFEFLKDLVYRSTLAPDTRYLQNLLNMNTETEIKVDRWDNSGSNKNLTDTFGKRTKSALERFHVFYNKEIQEEYKKTNPNATTTFSFNSNVLDFYTRTFMNKLVLRYAKNDNVATTTATTTISQNESSSSNAAVLAAIAAIALSSSGGGSTESSTKSATGIIPFGGRSTMMIPCTCSANILLYITDPKGVQLQLIYQPGVTVLYQMGNPSVNVNMLGQYVAGGVCMVYVGTGCSSTGSPMGTMIQLGTSLTAAGI